MGQAKRQGRGSQGFEIKLAPRWRLLPAGLALAVLTLLAFSDSFTTGFALDNQLLILGDPRVHQVSAQTIGDILNHSYWWPNGESGLYRPLTTLSYLFNYAILGNGSWSAGYHWVNLLLHAGNVLLVFALALRLVRRLWMAWFIAALWAVHPVLTESVTNIVGRADLLAAMAVLGGFLLYLKSAETSGGRRVACLAGLAVAAAAGAFSKESAVILPAVIVAYEIVWWKKRPALLWGLAATVLPIAAMLLQRSVVLGASLPAEFPFVDNPIAGADFWTGRLTAIKVLARYLWLAIWPARLSADYSYSEIPLARGSLNDWIAWMAIAAALVLTAVLWKRNRTAFFFACFALLNILPTANLIFPVGTILAERFLYLPAVGLVASIVLAIEAASPRADVTAALLSLIAIGFGVRTWVRNLDWKDDLTMAAASVQTSPRSFKVHRLLATALFQSDPSRSNLDRELAEGDKSIAILEPLPDDLDLPEPWNLAAAWHLAKGDLSSGGKIGPQGTGRAQYEEAVRIARRSISIEAATRAAYDRRHGMTAPVPPAAATGYRILASAYLRLGEADHALQAAIPARTIDPANTEVYAEIADSYLAQNRGEEAATALAEGMFRTSDPALRENLLALYRGGVDTKGCAIVPGPRGPALNPACEIVRRDLCAGAARANRLDLFRQLSCPNQAP